MTITHATATRNSLADLIDSLVNTGAGTAILRLRATAVTVVDFSLSNPAFGAAASGTITLNSTPIAAVASGTGEVDNFQVLDRDGTLIFSGSVTLTSGGGDIEVDNTNIVAAQNCSLDSFTYTAPN